MKKVSILFASVIALLAAQPGLAQSGAWEQLASYAGGLPTAPVKIEVFSDYQCPACRKFYLETIKQVMIEYSQDNKVSVVYHDFPLQAHPHSPMATRFALAAQRLGREQWLRVIDSLYADQTQWSENGNIELVIARALSPEDLVKVKEMIHSPEIDNALQQSIELAKNRSIRSTPTFFITANGKEQRVVGGVSYPILKYYIDQLLR